MVNLRNFVAGNEDVDCRKDVIKSKVNCDDEGEVGNFPAETRMHIICRKEC